METEAYMAVRKSEDKVEWIDTSTASCLKDHTRQKANRMNLLIPDWGIANPVQRIVRFKITEVGIT